MASGWLYRASDRPNPVVGVDRHRARPIKRECLYWSEYNRIPAYISHNLRLFAGSLNGRQDFAGVVHTDKLIYLYGPEGKTDCSPCLCRGSFGKLWWLGRKLYCLSHRELYSKKYAVYFQTCYLIIQHVEVPGDNSGFVDYTIQPIHQKPGDNPSSGIRISVFFRSPGLYY